MIKLKCNICGKALSKSDGGYSCDEGHIYPVFSEGYIDFIGSRSDPKREGNPPEIVEAKRDFLSKGYFSILSEAIEDTVMRLLKLCPGTAVLADCCCGEGYYTRNLAAELKRSGKSVEMFAFDLSRTAVEMAAKQGGDALYAYADVFDMPLADASVDIALNCFGPVPDAEIARILKPGGLFVSVIPGRMHLYAMKSALFDIASVVDESGHVSQTMTRVKQIRVRDEIAISDLKDLKNLFMMTPEIAREGEYYIDRLKRLRDLEIEIDFILQIFRKAKSASVRE